MTFLDIAIVSDLHAFDDPQGKEDPSYLSVSLPENEPGKHPIAALLELIKKEGLRANLLLCGGDRTPPSQRARQPPLHTFTAIQAIGSICR